MSVLRQIIGSDPPAAMSITNQRETIVIWDWAMGAPIHNAIVWQDRRTANIFVSLRASGVEPMVQARAGLLLDRYFLATKLKWLLDTIPGARAQQRACWLQARSTAFSCGS